MGSGFGDAFEGLGIKGTGVRVQLERSGPTGVSCIGVRLWEFTAPA